MSILSIVQEAAEMLIIESPATLVGNTDPQVAQLRSIFRSLGRELLRDAEWNELITLWTAPITADPQTVTFPADRDRSLLKARVWRTSSLTPLVGPISSSDSTFLRNNTAGNFPGYWRNFQGGLQIVGLGTSDTIDTEYISNQIYTNAAGDTNLKDFTADDDRIRIADEDEELFKLGLVWKWRKAKRLDYAEDLQDYELYKEKAMARNRDAKPRSMSSRQTADEIESTFRGSIVVS